MIVATAKNGSIAEVWLISLNEGREFDELAENAKHVGLSVRRYRVISQAALHLCSGIVGVPTTIVTNNDRVLLAHSGLLNDNLLGTALKIMDRPGESAEFLPLGAVGTLLGDNQ